MKILNLYAGIGGNRVLWGDDHDITAVELDPEIAKAYQDRFPGDTVIVEDAKQYLLDHYKEFDFIWASPPCQTHSRARRARVNTKYQNGNDYNAVYPDLSLYQIVLLLDNYFSGKWVVENVIPFYTPIIPPSANIDRHYYWSNFKITEINIEKKYRIRDVNIDTCEFDLKKYKIKRKDQVIRNQVNEEIGKHILDCATNSVTHKQGGLF